MEIERLFKQSVVLTAKGSYENGQEVKHMAPAVGWTSHTFPGIAVVWESPGRHMLLHTASGYEIAGGLELPDALSLATGIAGFIDWQAVESPEEVVKQVSGEQGKAIRAFEAEWKVEPTATLRGEEEEDEVDAFLNERISE